MAATQMMMAPLLGFQPGLEPIGSVSANFARTEEDERHDEYLRFAYRSRSSDYALQMYGQKVHDELLASSRAENEKAQLEEVKRQERCRRIRKGLKEFFRSLNFFSPGPLAQKDFHLQHAGYPDQFPASKQHIELQQNRPSHPGRTYIRLECISLPRLIDAGCLKSNQKQPPTFQHSYHWLFIITLGYLVFLTPSLGSTTDSKTVSTTPNPVSKYTSTQRPPLPPQLSASAAQGASATKSSLAQPNLGRSPASSDGSPRSVLKPTQAIRSSPLTPVSRRPAMVINTSHKVISGDDLEVGDTVDVPGGMHGIIKFIGEVKGKKGIFAGVELSREWAARGKNDGDVEGTRYFTTSIPGAGIFLPSNKAFKRASPTDSSNSFPPTPTTPPLAAFNPPSQTPGYSQTPPTPLPSRFSQSIGPGRAASPAFKPKSRPSLPRPESPLRKTQNVTSTPIGRPSLNAPKFSRSIVGTPRHAPSPTPGKFGGSVRGIPGDPGKRPRLNPGYSSVRAPRTTRPESRTPSRLGPEAMFDEDVDTSSVGLAKTVNGASRPHPRSRPVSNQEEEVQKLKTQLAERDKQLEEHAANLAEMENSVTQLQSSMPQQRPNAIRGASKTSVNEDADVAQLRALLREKNDKIAMLTADFDAHRADFRSTIDTLELASTETERVYERKVEELTQEIRELQDRGEDVESVAQQLKQLEELVQELEEGLEDARRGEAEARGEVEFLRGEVERGRSELKRERDKAAAALKGAGAAAENGISSRELEQRDDEIRGLKAIIHSLSRDAPDAGSPKSGSRRVSRQRNSALNQVDGASDDQLAEERKHRERLEREVQELEGLVDRKTYREEELEREIERLRNVNRHSATSTSDNGYNNESPTSGRIAAEAMAKWHQHSHQQQSPNTQDQKPLDNTDSHSIITDASNLWCEICETAGHDILTCTSMFTNNGNNNHLPPQNGNTHQTPTTKPITTTTTSPTPLRTGRDAVKEGLKGLAISSPSHDDRPAPLSPSPNKSAPVTPKASMPNPMDQEMVAGKASGVVDPS
ncbi:MAG: hypothetical protein Q9184_001823, partial [Pyrenodesmia sp. 2 TL-2023]